MNAVPSRLTAHTPPAPGPSPRGARTHVRTNVNARELSRIARREYRAVGIHMTLSPQADLFTEPRWPRAAGTFGSSSAMTSRLVRAYVEGFQNGARGLGGDGVAVVVKHWVGYGAQPAGFDGHNYYGRFARLSDASFPNHVAAFDGAFAARVSGVMPAFPVVQGVTLNGRAIEPVAPGFSVQLLDELLRGEKRFNGLVLSDWAITKNCDEACRAPTATQPQEPPSIATPWGVESLSRPERFAKAVAAGIDQFGGTGESELLLEAIRANRISERRLEESVQRIMVLKFQMGLFNDPYVDLAVTAATMENATSQREADTAQRRTMVLLENRNELIPLPRQRSKVWLHGLDPEEARRAGLTVVESPAEADVAIVRVVTPSELLHPHHFFGQRQREGRLDFREDDPDYRAIVQASASVPALVVIELDRAAILTAVREKAGAILATFGASDAAVLDVILGRATAEGILPFELPSSMEAVEAQDPALPDDSRQPLYPAGAGAKR
jgi:beta-glucosidase